MTCHESLDLLARFLQALPLALTMWATLLYWVSAR